MTTVLITGARGFIAGRLAQALSAAGQRVVGVSHSAGGGAPDAASYYARIYKAALGDSLWDVLTGEKVDAVVHTALDGGPDAYARNVSGTGKWLQEAKQAGVTTQIFLSSLSADAEAAADYGRAKYALEQKFLEAGQIVFRLGVVVGPGGMFARMVESATRLPFAPLLDGGSQRVYVVNPDGLTGIIGDAVAQPAALCGRAWNLQQAEPYTLREVVEAILRARGRTARLVALPTRPIAALLAVFERQRLIRLPVTSTNVRGLLQGAERIFPSDYARFGYPVESLDTLVARALIPPA